MMTEHPVRARADRAVCSSEESPMRRFAVCTLAFFMLTGTLLVLPVYAAPLPAAHPVGTSIDDVPLGSVVEPEGDAVVGLDGAVLPKGTDGVDSGGSATATPSAPATATSSDAATTTPSDAATPSSAAPTTGSAASDDDLVVSGRERRGVPA